MTGSQYAVIIWAACCVPLLAQEPSRQYGSKIDPAPKEEEIPTTLEYAWQQALIKIHPRAVDRHERPPAEMAWIHESGVTLRGDVPWKFDLKDMDACLSDIRFFWDRESAARRIDWRKVVISFGEGKLAKGAYVLPFSSRISFSKSEWADRAGIKGWQFCLALNHEIAHVWGNQNNTPTGWQASLGQGLIRLLSLGHVTPYIQSPKNNGMEELSVFEKVIKLHAEGGCARDLGGETLADILMYYWSLKSSFMSSDTAIDRQMEDTYPQLSALLKTHKTVVEDFAQQTLDPTSHPCSRTRKRRF